MSLIETLTAWDAAVNLYDGNVLKEAFDKFEEIQNPSAKLLFNKACVQIQQGCMNDSLQYLNACLKKDEHMAVGFYQKGVVLHGLERFDDSMTCFKHCLTRLRGKSVIDYKQLGLDFKLYECEVLNNIAACYSKLSDFANALEVLRKAQGCKSEQKHSITINKSLELLQAGYAPDIFHLPKDAIFRPPKSKTANMAKKNYLGTAKVLSSVKDNDTFSGFTGPQQVEEERKKTLSKSAPSSPSSSHRAKHSSSPGSPALHLSPVQHIKDSLSPEARRRNRSPSPIGKYSKPTDLHQSPELTKRRIQKPPPPNKPAPRLIVTSSLGAGDLFGSEISRKFDGGEDVREYCERSKEIKKRWSNAISQVMKDAKNLPPPVPSRDTKPKHLFDRNLESNKMSQSTPSLFSESEGRSVRIGKENRTIPPPPTKPLPVPPKRNELTRRSNEERTSPSYGTKGKPQMPPQEKKMCDDEAVSIVMHCNQPVTMHVQSGLPLHKLIAEACKVFKLANGSIDLWWHNKDIGDKMKIDNEIEMAKVWKQSTGEILNLWCYAKQ